MFFVALLLEGESLLGVYEVERFLVEGAFAEVYRVEHGGMGGGRVAAAC